MGICSHVALLGFTLIFSRQLPFLTLFVRGTSLALGQVEDSFKGWPCIRCRWRV